MTYAVYCRTTRADDDKSRRNRGIRQGKRTGRPENPLQIEINFVKYSMTRKLTAESNGNRWRGQ